MTILAVLPVSLWDGDVGRLALGCEVGGRLPLDHVLARLAGVNGLTGLVVATSTSVSDEPVEAFCRARGIACFRGAKEAADDRLGLVLAAARSSGARAVLLVGADTPLIDPAILQRVADLVLLTDGMLDFVGTTLARTYPGGMAVEAATVAALEDADRRCADPATRRDAMAYLRQNSRLYRLLVVEAETELARPDLRFDLATEADLEVIAAIFARFDGRSDISLRELIDFADFRAG
jgi:spore coat polysaccharide biosynthesis protein SpsF